MVTRIDICNRALTGIGLDPIQSETADGAETVLDAYDEILEDFLSRFDWHFCSKTRQLARLADAPAAKWDYEFELPAERLGPPRAYYPNIECTALVLSFELSRDRVLCNENALWAKYTSKPDPLDWPGYFRRCVILGVKSELAMSVIEDERKQALFERKLYGPPQDEGNGGLLGNAMTLDSQAKPSPVLKQQAGSLVLARRR